MYDHREQSRAYWRALGSMPIGQRNVVAENLRVAQLLNIFSRYNKELVFSHTPLVGVRQFFQRHIYRKKSPISGASTAETVRLMLQELGPTFVKLGQIVSSRADHLPADWREELTKLQSDAEPFPFEEVERLVIAELGKPPHELYPVFEETPMAAASTAQVHRAVMADGAPVVVKVQRPDIDVTVKAELNVMRDMTRIMERRFDWASNSDLNGLMSEYASNVVIELDYTNEALNGKLLAKNMEVYPRIHVPTIYDHYSTKRLMTQEFIDGVKITDVAALDAAGLDRTELGRIFTSAIVKQVLFDGFFHGDPHPGNVLVDTETGQIVFLDMGMMGTLDSDKRMAMADLIWSLEERDAHEIGRVTLSLTTRFKEVDEQRFIQSVERLMNRYTTLNDGNVSLSGAMNAMFTALFDAGLRLDPDLTLALKAMIQAEEIVAKLDPSLPLIQIAFAESRRLLIAQFNPDVVTQALRRQAIRGAKEAVRQIPDLQDAITSWTRQFTSGKFTVYVDANQVSRQISELDRTLTYNTKRLILGMLLVGLLIGSAIASTVPTSSFPGMGNLAHVIFLVTAMVTGAITVRWLWRWLNEGQL